MDKEISEQFSKQRADLSVLSIKTYTNCLTKVLEIMKAKDVKILYDNPDIVIETMKNFYKNANTLKTKFGSILAFLSLLKSNKEVIQAQTKYLTETDNLNQIIKDKLKDNLKDDKQRRNMITKEEQKQVEEHLKSELIDNPRSFDDYIKLRNYVIFKLYMAIPSRLDFADAKILYSTDNHESDEYNYIILNKKHKTSIYIMNAYKTFKSYGQKIINIDKELYDLLNDYKKIIDKFHRESYFLLNHHGRQMTRNNLSIIYKSFGNVIDKPITVSGNRHDAVSNIIPIEDMKELSNKMAHSIDEAIKVYVKL